MNKICTSLEQSKKLIELGIDVNTADVCWSIDIPDLPTLLAYPITDCDNWENKIPAWSLSALLKLFDDKAGLAKEYGTWFAYDNGKSHCDKHCDDPVDAAFEMVCWLKENEKI